MKPKGSWWDVRQSSSIDQGVHGIDCTEEQDICGAWSLRAELLHLSAGDLSLYSYVIPKFIPIFLLLSVITLTVF